MYRLNPRVPLGARRDLCPLLGRAVFPYNTIKMSRPSRNAPIWVKLFVAFHLIAILIWALPYAPAPVRNGAVSPIGSDYILLANERYAKQFPLVRTYLATTGFWQYWDMFSPNPADTDVWGDALIVREDGTRETYAYPRMFTLNLWDKFLLERYRKFYERAHRPENQFLWARFAAVVASKVDHDPKNRPIEVQLRRHEQVLGGPDNPELPPYIDETYFVWKVSWRDLDQVKEP